MKIGIGLPATIPGVNGATVLDWARRADAGPFSSLGIIDRLIYGNFESMITLAAVAGATRRIGLLTSILLAPLRNTVILAKEAATLDALSGGRLTLGLGIGVREDDFVATGGAFKKRGRTLEAQLEQMKRIWAGEPAVAGQRPIGPAVAQKGGPRLLAGGYNPAALARAGRLADGYITGGGADPVQVQHNYQLVEKAWREANRPGKPYLVSCFYVVAGEELAERAGVFIHDYYGQAGPIADRILSSIPKTPQVILDKIHGLAAIGVDEIILWPTVTDLDQVDRLAEVIGKV